MILATHLRRLCEDLASPDGDEPRLFVPGDKGEPILSAKDQQAKLLATAEHYT